MRKLTGLEGMKPLSVRLSKRHRDWLDVEGRRRGGIDITAVIRMLIEEGMQRTTAETPATSTDDLELRVFEKLLTRLEERRGKRAAHNPGYRLKRASKAPKPLPSRRAA